MTRRLLVACAIAIVAATLARLFGRLEAATSIVLTFACLVAFIAWALPRVGVSLADRVVMAVRSFLWRHEQGRHHAFGGLPLSIVDDGRHVWVAGDDLQRVLGTHDPDDVLAARHSARWRRDDAQRLWLRVDAVVAHLQTAPTRMDPRTLRLCHYLERQVLFPAAERGRRSARP